MTKKNMKKSLLVIGIFIILLTPTVNVINEDEVISIIIESFIIGIGAFTLIINTRDLEKANIKMTIKNKHYENYDTKQMKKFEKNIKFSEMTDIKAMIWGFVSVFIYGIIITILKKPTEDDEIADMWGDYLGDTLTFMVFAFLIFHYIYKIKDEEVKEDKEDEKEIYSNEFKRRSNISIVVSIIKSIFNILLGGSVIYSSSEAAELIGIKTATLRMYSLLLESHGYEIKRNSKRHRYYRDEDVITIRNVIARSDNGATLEESVKNVINLEGYSNEPNETNNSYATNDRDMKELKELVYNQNELIFSLIERLDQQQEYINKQIDIKLNESTEIKQIEAPIENDPTIK